MKGRKGKAIEATDGAAKRCPAPPSWLSAHAKAEWKRASRELFDRKILAPDMLATLESYCVAIGQVRETEETMQAQGRIVETDTGMKTHPAFRIQASAMREARLLAAELGLTPHRRYVGKDDDEGENDDVPAALLG